MTEHKPHIHYSKELEMTILGTYLIEKLAFGRTYGVLTGENFYYSFHATVYNSIKEMYDASVPIDLITVTQWIVENKKIYTLDGNNVPYFLSKLTSSVVSSANLEYHSHLLKEMWRRREILKIKYSPVSDGIDSSKDLTEINIQLNRITNTSFKQDWYDMSELIFQLIKHQHEVKDNKKIFLPTGFRKIDEKNGGFYAGQLIAIGARPGVGKSALMGMMALQMAAKGKKVGIISLEMNNIEIAARLSAIETNTSFHEVFRTLIYDEEQHKIFYDKVSRGLVNLPIYLSDKTRVNINEIKAKATKLKHSKGLDCLIIDYLQLIDTASGNKNYNREQEVATMSRGLKLMAHDLEIPVIILCQLNREVTKRSYKDRLPKLSDFRESGAIEQDADVVMFIHRDYTSGWQTDESGNSTEFNADLVGAKWRNGSTFHLELDFDPPKMHFKEKAFDFNFRPAPIYRDEDNDKPF